MTRAENGRYETLLASSKPEKPSLEHAASQAEGSNWAADSSGSSGTAGFSGSSGTEGFPNWQSPDEPMLTAGRVKTKESRSSFGGDPREDGSISLGRVDLSKQRGSGEVIRSKVPVIHPQ